MYKRLAAVFVAIPVLSLAQTPEGDPLAYLGTLKNLAGACWQGTDASGRATDRQCYEIQFGRYLRGTIAIGAIDNKPPGFRGDSLFHRDPRSGRITVVMWGSNGSVNTGEAVIEGDAIRFPLPKVEGRPETRTSWTWQGTDAFRVVRERREGEAWTPVLVVNYRKVAP